MARWNWKQKIDIVGDLMNKGHRVIFHIDMNCYFASVEIANRPDLKGKPVAIAGNVKERKGIIITCSYEARDTGVYTTMPLWEGLKRCPNLIVLPPNHTLYRETAYKVFHLLGSFSPILEPASIDEVYLDVTHVQHLHPVQLAKEIQNTVLEKMGLPCSIGIAPNKFLAKMASDMRKPLGITVLRKRDIPDVLWPLPVESMHGIGYRTKKKYHALNIYTIEDLAKADVQQLQDKIGKIGRLLHERANGKDMRPVDPEHILSFKTMGNSITLPQNLCDEKALAEVFHHLCQKLSQRLIIRRAYAKTIQIMIRYGNRQTITRSQALLNPVQSSDELFKMAVLLFQRHWDGESVRLLGVSAIETLDEKEWFKQLDLLSYQKEIPKKMKLSDLAVEINKKLGQQALMLGCRLKNEKKVFKSEAEKLYEYLNFLRKQMNDS